MMERRKFIKAVSLSAAALSAPVGLGSTILINPKVGLIGDIFRLAGLENTVLNEANEITSFSSGLKHLAERKIDVLVTSPFFLIKDNPEFSLMGHFPGDLPHASKEKFIIDNYNFVKNHYAGLGLRSEFVGMTSSEMVRVTRLGAEDLNNFEQTRPRIAANGQRKIWYEHTGFRAVSDGFIDKAHFQLILLIEKRLDITEAFNPLLFLNSIQSNKKDNIDFHQYGNLNLVLDEHSRRGLGVELLFRPDTPQFLIDETREKLKAYLEFESKAQKQAVAVLREVFLDNTIQNLPENAVASLINCRDRYLDVLENYNGISSAMVSDFKKSLKA